MITIANKRKTTTSTEVKNRWNTKTYKKYQVNFRKEEDADIIQFIEETKKEKTTSEIFREAIEKLKG